MFWQDNYFSSSFFKKNINSNSRFSYVNSDYAKTSEQKYSAGNKCFEKSSDSSSHETFVDYSEGANILEQMSWSKLCSDFFNTFFANRNVVSDSTDQASTDNSYGSGTNDGIMTLAMLEEGGSSLDGQISTKAMYEEGGSDSIGGSTGDDTSGETNLNDGIMTLAMLEEGGSSLDGQISTKAMYEEGGSDSDKPSLGDKPFWGHHHWGHHHWGHHHWGGGAVTLAMLECGGSTDGAQDVKPPSSDNDTDIPSVDDNNGSCEEQPEVDEPQDDFSEITLPGSNSFGSVSATTFIAYEDGGQ